MLKEYYPHISVSSPPVSVSLVFWGRGHVCRMINLIKESKPGQRIASNEYAFIIYYILILHIVISNTIGMCQEDCITFINSQRLQSSETSSKYYFKRASVFNGI